jgi:hypothetical protein
MLDDLGIDRDLSITTEGFLLISGSLSYIQA